MMNPSLRYATDFVLFILIIGLVLVVAAPPAGIELDRGQGNQATAPWRVT